MRIGDKFKLRGVLYEFLGHHGNGRILALSVQSGVVKTILVSPGGMPQPDGVEESSLETNCFDRPELDMLIAGDPQQAVDGNQNASDFNPQAKGTASPREEHPPRGIRAIDLASVAAEICRRDGLLATLFNAGHAAAVTGKSQGREIATNKGLRGRSEKDQPSRRFRRTPPPPKGEPGPFEAPSRVRMSDRDRTAFATAYYRKSTLEFRHDTCTSNHGNPHEAVLPSERAYEGASPEEALIAVCEGMIEPEQVFFCGAGRRGHGTECQMLDELADGALTPWSFASNQDEPG